MEPSEIMNREIVMVVRGRVKNGVVVPDAALPLADGTEVRIEFGVPAHEEHLLDDQGQTLGQRLLKFAGKAEELPGDAARNHDHYLYGTPKA
jgi:hypothetical protein